MKVALVVVCLAILGCSSRGSYESIQASNRQQCQTLPPSQYDECMQNVSKSYQEYDRERRAVKKVL